MNFRSPPIVSKAIRNLPKNAEIPCTLFLYGCREDPQYVVHAHLRGKRDGMAMKPDDFFGIYACDRCHDVLDRRLNHAERPSSTIILNALYISLKLMFQHGAMEAKI